MDGHRRPGSLAATHLLRERLLKGNEKIEKMCKYSWNSMFFWKQKWKFSNFDVFWFFHKLYIFNFFLSLLLMLAFCVCFKVAINRFFLVEKLFDEFYHSIAHKTGDKSKWKESKEMMNQVREDVRKYKKWIFFPVRIQKKRKKSSKLEWREVKNSKFADSILNTSQQPRKYQKSDFQKMNILKFCHVICFFLWFSQNFLSSVQFFNFVFRYNLTPEGLMKRHQQLTQYRHKGNSPWSFSKDEIYLVKHKHRSYAHRFTKRLRKALFP